MPAIPIQNDGVLLTELAFRIAKRAGRPVPREGVIKALRRVDAIHKDPQGRLRTTDEVAAMVERNYAATGHFVRRRARSMEPME